MTEVISDKNGNLFDPQVTATRAEKEPVQSKNTLLYGAAGFADVRIANIRIRPMTLNNFI